MIFYTACLLNFKKNVKVPTLLIIGTRDRTGGKPLVSEEVREKQWNYTPFSEKSKENTNSN
jgi:hypothetical protein